MAIEKELPHCFVSYHDKDKKYLDQLLALGADLKIADPAFGADSHRFTEEDLYMRLRQTMRKCSVTVVLVGAKTGHQKSIDHEIWASLRAHRNHSDPSNYFSPNGILAIYLPTDLSSVPARLEDNIKTGYAVVMKWENLANDFENNLKLAYWNKTINSYKILNSRALQQRDKKELVGFKKMELHENNLQK